MDNDPSDVRNVLVDPRLLFAATSLVLAASLGTCRLTASRLGRRVQTDLLTQNAHLNPQNQLESQGNHQPDVCSAGDKKKRAKDRRKRATVPKPSNSTAQSPNSNPPPSLLPQKKVIRQPSALGGARRQRVHEVCTSEVEPSIPESSSQAESSKLVLPQDIPLPPSPKSLSITSSPNSSTAPLTPPSTAVAQLPLPILAPDPSSSWHWTSTSESANHPKSPSHGVPLLSPQQPPRGRKRRANSPDATPLIPKPIEPSLPTPLEPASAPFPTLNILPPPNTPHDAQIEFMRQQVESSRAHENAARAREDELFGEVQRAREEMDKARKDVEALRWQLGEMSQREERLIGQLNALTMHMQHMGIPVPVPLYSPHSPRQSQPSGHPIPMPIPYHAYYYPNYARASPGAIPVPMPSGSIPVSMPVPMPPTPTSLFSPTLVNPLFSVSHGTGSTGSPAPNEAEDPDTGGSMIDYGLVEAIFKRPESYASVGRSHGRDSRASTRGTGSRASDAGDSRAGGSIVEGNVNGKTGVSGVDSMDLRSPAESSSVSGQEWADTEHAYGGSVGKGEADEGGSGRDCSRAVPESATESTLPVEGFVKTQEKDEVGAGYEWDDNSLPASREGATNLNARNDHWGLSSQNDYVTIAPGVPVFY